MVACAVWYSQPKKPTGLVGSFLYDFAHVPEPLASKAKQSKVKQDTRTNVMDKRVGVRSTVIVAYIKLGKKSEEDSQSKYIFVYK